MTGHESNRKSLPLSLWPEGDRVSWSAAQHAASVFEPSNAAHDWAKSTRHEVERAYGRWLAWLDLGGHLTPSTKPGDRVTSQRVATYVAYLRSVVGPVTVYMQTAGLHAMLKAIEPDADWSWLRKIIKGLKRSAKSQRNKRQLIVRTDELFNLGISLMRFADTTGSHPMSHAAQYMDGLMIALLAVRPLRMRNFKDIRLGQSLIFRDDTYFLVFKSEETKNHRPIDVHWPERLLPYLELYLDLHRPRLMNQCRNSDSHAALWVAKNGRPLGEQSIRKRIKARTKQAFGHCVTPHLFRDCAATSIAIEDPDHVRIIASLLGHTTLATAERYYNQATSLEAGRTFAAGLENLRTQLREAAE